MANGLLDWKSGELRSHTPDHLSTIQLPVKWDPDATCPGIARFLSEVLPDEACSALVFEIAGYAFYPRSLFHKAVMLCGPGRNGKSVLLSILRAMLGEGNVAAVPLQRLSETPFAVAQLCGKLGNICGDLDARAIHRTDMFKMLTGGDAIHAEKKFKPPFEFKSFALPIFAANEVPLSADQTPAWFERWLIVPMARVLPLRRWASGSHKDFPLRVGYHGTWRSVVAAPTPGSTW